MQFVGLGALALIVVGAAFGLALFLRRRSAVGKIASPEPGDMETVIEPDRDTLCLSLTCEMDDSWGRSALRAPSRSLASKSRITNSFLWATSSDEED
jgi:hypothetical protein